MTMQEFEDRITVHVRKDERDNLCDLLAVCVQNLKRATDSFDFEAVQEAAKCAAVIHNALGVDHERAERAS